MLRLVVPDRHLVGPIHPGCPPPSTRDTSGGTAAPRPAPARVRPSPLWIIRRISPSVATHSSGSTAARARPHDSVRRRCTAPGSSPEASNNVAACLLSLRTRPGSLVHGQRVQVDDAEQGVSLVLVDVGPPSHGPEIVPQRQMPGRLDPTEDPRSTSSTSWSRPPHPQASQEGAQKRPPRRRPMSTYVCTAAVRRPTTAGCTYA